MLSIILLQINVKCISSLGDIELLIQYKLRPTKMDFFFFRQMSVLLLGGAKFR